MSNLFKNSLLTISGLVLLSGFGFRIMLTNSSIVPAWVPPPICLCWDSIGYQCLPISVCRGSTTIQPTPTPYQQQIIIKPQDLKIQTIQFSQDCKVTITNTASQDSTFMLPSDRTISSTFCPTDIKYYLSDNSKYVVFNNFANPKKPGATIYSLALNKVVTLENWTNDRITDALFLSDNHLILLLPNKINSYDLNTLFSNYPGNIDFYQNKFKSISLESSSINLTNLRDFPTSLKLDGNSLLVRRADDQTIESFDLVKLYPRSSCPCWDTTANYCLPQSSCLNIQP